MTVIVTGPDVLLLALASASELTLAVLSMAGQVAAGVVAVRVMDFVACGAIIPMLLSDETTPSG